MLAYQSFELQIKHHNGEPVQIPQVFQQWQAGMRALKELGYQLLVCKTATGGIPHSVLVGFNIERFHELGNVKEVFYELTDALGLPFKSGEFYDDSVMDGRV